MEQITSRQRLAIGAIVIAGLAAFGGIYYFDRGDSPATPAKAAPAEPTANAASAATAPEHAEEEGHVKLSADEARSAGIVVKTAGAAAIRQTAPFQGEIRFNEDRTAHVVPRQAGVVDSVSANLGQPVRKGDLLAVILSQGLSEQRSELLTAQERQALARSTWQREKELFEQKISAQQDFLAAQAALQEADIAVQNASQKLAAVGALNVSPRGLNRFELRAPFDGMVVEKHLALGEAVREDASIFLISDLSTVWAEFPVAAKDLAVVRVGQKVIVSSTAFAGTAEGRIAYVGALLGEQTRAARVRVTLTNPDGAWRPGLFVTVSVLGEEAQVSVAIASDAIQTIEGKTSVFVETPVGFKAVPVRLGRTDGALVEVIDGLRSGAPYAAKNSFVLKSELGKGDAEHGH